MTGPRPRCPRCRTYPDSSIGNAHYGVGDNYPGGGAPLLPRCTYCRADWAKRHGGAA